MGNSGTKSPDIYEDEWSEPPSDIVTQSSDEDSLASAHSNLDNVPDGSEKNHNLAPERLELSVLESAYLASLKHFRLASYALKEATCSENKKSKDSNQWTVSFAYRKQADALNPLSSALSTRAKRIHREMAALADSLPIALDSSIFVVADEARPDVIKALITGPSDTPYAHGCFEFDIFFPEQYPHKPPLVNLATTGGGKCRFNPNLYANGYVCLSVINTWQGRPEEQWNPYLSLHKVLLAIQAFVFVKQPFFNEPGFRKMEGREWGEKCSRRYNARVRHATLLYALLHQLRFPTPCFRDLIRQHCKLKRQLIFDTIELWLQELHELAETARDGDETAAVANGGEGGGGGDSAAKSAANPDGGETSSTTTAPVAAVVVKKKKSKSSKIGATSKSGGGGATADASKSGGGGSGHHATKEEANKTSSILNISKWFSLSHVANAVAPVGGISVEGMELTAKKLRKELLKLGPIFEPAVVGVAGENAELVNSGGEQPENENDVNGEQPSMRNDDNNN